MERLYIDALQHGSTDADNFDALSRNLTYRRNGDIIVSLVPGPGVDGRRGGAIERRSGLGLGEEEAATGDRTVGCRNATAPADDARSGEEGGGMGRLGTNSETNGKVGRDQWR